MGVWVGRKACPCRLVTEYLDVDVVVDVVVGGEVAVSVGISVAVCVGPGVAVSRITVGLLGVGDSVASISGKTILPSHRIKVNKINIPAPAPD